MADIPTITGSRHVPFTVAASVAVPGACGAPAAPSGFPGPVQPLLSRASHGNWLGVVTGRPGKNAEAAGRKNLACCLNCWLTLCVIVGGGCAAAMACTGVRDATIR